MSLQSFLEGYTDAMLWANAEWDMEGGSVPAELTLGEMSREDYRALVNLDDATAFYESERKMLKKMNKRYRATDNRHGHDFALTRNGHGAGFWDRGYGGAGDYLTRQARAYGEEYISLPV